MPMSTKGHGLLRFPLNCYILNILALDLMVSERGDLSFSHFKAMRANEHRDVANLDPRVMFGKIYVSDYLILLHTKYLNSGHYGFRKKKDF